MKTPARFWFGCALFVSFLILVFYGVVYQLQPFAETFWNDFTLNGLTILTAGLTACAALLVMSRHDRQEPGFMVWLHFSSGYILWFLAEIVWAIYSSIYEEVPVPSPPDYLWLLGYIIFGIGFLQQYRIIYPTGSIRKEWGAYGLILVAILLITWGTQLLYGEPGSLGNYVDMLYPVLDLAICVVALGIARAFGRGAMGRPWLAMVIMGLSDGLYAWLVQTGAYAWSAENGNITNLFVDETYIAAYLVLALGFLLQYFLLRYGPWAFKTMNSHAD